MPPELLLLDDVRVTTLANVMSGMRDRARRNLSNRIPAIVPVLTERLRYNCCAQQGKSDQGDRHHHSQPDQVLNVLEQQFTPATEP